MPQRPRFVPSIRLGLPQELKHGRSLPLWRVSQVEQQLNRFGKIPSGLVTGSAGLGDGNPAPEFGLIQTQLGSKQLGFLAGFNEAFWLVHRVSRIVEGCVFRKLFHAFMPKYT